MVDQAKAVVSRGLIASLIAPQMATSSGNGGRWAGPLPSSQALREPSGDLITPLIALQMVTSSGSETFITEKRQIAIYKYFL